jgi:N-acetylglucosamine-6-phosphate deacetylase
MIYTDIPFASAIVHATRTPAILLGLEREMGVIAPGRRADLSVWDEQYQPIATIVGGHAVHGGAHLLRPTRARA